MSFDLVKASRLSGVYPVPPCNCCNQKEWRFQPQKNVSLHDQEMSGLMCLLNPPRKWIVFSSAPQQQLAPAFIPGAVLTLVVLLIDDKRKTEKCSRLYLVQRPRVRWVWFFSFYSFSVLQLIKHLYIYHLLCTSQLNFQALQTPDSTSQVTQPQSFCIVFSPLCSDSYQDPIRVGG